MATVNLDLRPDKYLLDPHFNGYKLSLKEIPTVKKDLKRTIRPAVPNQNQYSYLNVKLFALHNHLEGETIDGVDYVYFTDESSIVNKARVDSLNEMQIEEVWRIPKIRETQSGDYNNSLKFVSENLVVISDGIQTLWLVNSGLRSQEGEWTEEFKVTFESPFIIQDAFYKKEVDKSEIHCLLYRIASGKTDGCEKEKTKEDSSEANSREKEDKIQEKTQLDWIIISKSGESQWVESSRKTLTAKGSVHYAQLERSGLALYTASESGVEFTSDSETPLEAETPNNRYIWSQTNEDVCVKFKLPQDFQKNNLKIETSSSNVKVWYKDMEILNGKLFELIDESLTTWTTTTSIYTTVEIVLFKTNIGTNWPFVVHDDKFGLYVDGNELDDVHAKLAHLCSDDEQILPEPSLNTEKMEECDYEQDKCSVFERLTPLNHKATHRANVSSHNILLTCKMQEDSPSAFVLRHDVDACFWQPEERGGEFALKHSGTFPAFGYVQASKKDRKFISCAPDLSYVAICDSNRHIFVYKQSVPMTCGELRNRATGKRIETIAQQHIININNESLLGIYSSQNLFILTNERIYAFNVNSI